MFPTLLWSSPTRLLARPAILGLGLLVLAFGPGCPSSHDEQTAAADAAPTPIDDGGPLHDGGPIDARPNTDSEVPPTPCEDGVPIATDIVCTDAAGSSLRVLSGECVCGDEILSCPAMLYDESPGLINAAFITPTLGCGMGCSECEPFDGSCNIPSQLFDSSYAVSVGAYMLPTATNSLSRDTCWNIRQAPGEPYSCEFGALGSTALSGGTLCVPDEAANTRERIVVSVTTELTTCDIMNSGCRIERTADGFAIFPMQQHCPCPSCGPCLTPYSRTFTCELPPLEAGSYKIEYDGREETLTVADDGAANTACAPD